MKKNDILKKTPVLLYLIIFLVFVSFTKINENSYMYYFDSSSDYISLTVAGYNEDVIAETGNLAGTTTASVDKASDNFCYIASNVGISYGLPTNGELTNGNITYQLADYTSNNSLRLIGTSNSLAGPGGAEEGNPTSSTVIFSENENLETVYLAVTSGSGASSFSGTVIFNDTSTQAFSLTAPDWYASGTIIASNLGRGSRGDNSLSGAPSGGPYIFELSIAIDIANQSKTVMGINIQNDTAGDEVFNLFAVSGKIVPNCIAPTDLNAAITPTIATLSWVDTVASSWEVATQDAGTGLPTTNGQTVTTTTFDATNNINTLQEFYVRSLCPDNTSFSPWAGPFVYGGYAPLNASGYNADVIANGIGDASVSAPQNIDGAGYAYLCEDFKAQATDGDVGFGLPVEEFLYSSTTNGLKYEFNSYSSNNSLRIETNGVENTLTVSGIYEAEKIYFLITSGSGEAPISGMIYFSDNTSQAFSATIPDWYNSTLLPTAISGIGRINISTNAIQNPSNNPRIYELEVDVDVANQTKTISSIGITKDSGGVVNIFALSQKYSAAALSVKDFNDVFVSVYPNPVKNNLFIRSTDPVSIKVYNLLGKEISVNFEDNIANMSLLNRGIYLVKITNSLGKIKVFKVVKN